MVTIIATTGGVGANAATTTSPLSGELYANCPTLQEGTEEPNSDFDIWSNDGGDATCFFDKSGKSWKIYHYGSRIRLGTTQLIGSAQIRELLGGIQRIELGSSVLTYHKSRSVQVYAMSPCKSDVLTIYKRSR